MGEKEAIKAVAKAKGTTIAGLARVMGVEKSKLYERLKSKNMTMRVLKEILDAADYRIVLMPRGIRIPPGGVEICDTDTRE